MVVLRLRPVYFRQMNGVPRQLNLADLVAVITVIGCAVAAGSGAASEGAGWATAIFTVGGLVIGIACADGVGRVAYTILGAGIDLKSKWKAVVLLLAYMFVPITLAFGCMLVLFVLSAWITRMPGQ